TSCLGRTRSRRSCPRDGRRSRIEHLAAAGRSGKKWLAVLRNHREAILPPGLFTVPTISFRGLYCFLVIEHRRPKILQFNITRHPSADWVVQQLREAVPALHLGAALIWCNQKPRGRLFVCNDLSLGDAARQAGFTVESI